MEHSKYGSNSSLHAVIFEWLRQSIEPSDSSSENAWKWHIYQSITWQWNTTETCDFRQAYLFVKYLHIS